MTFAFDQETHTYTLGQRIIPGATAILKDAGFTYPDGNMEMGNAVHLATRYYDEGTLDISTVSDEVYPYLEAWIKFKLDTHFKPTRIEEPNVNAALMIAATLDREGMWDLGKARVLVEIKKYAPPYFTGLQLAIQDLTLPVLTLPRDRVAVELQASGNYKLHWFKDRNEHSLAIALVSLYWYKVNKK